MTNMWYISSLLVVLWFQESLSISASLCNENEFPCDDYSQCYSKRKLCDGNKHCDDCSDEKYCSQNYNTCRSIHFKCDNGQCIPAKGHCDELSSCKDGSDEKDCVLHFEDAMVAAKDWILSEIQEDYSWGEDTQRAVIALSLADPTYFQNNTDKTSVLISQRLQLQLALDLARNGSTPISLFTLSLYVTALLASCNDPFNFYGLDLVEELRLRTDGEQESGNFVSPSIYLVLCLNGKSKNSDFIKMREVFTSTDSTSYRTDVQALAILALSCISTVRSYQNGSEWTMKSLQEFLSKISIENPGNIYTTALILQATMISKQTSYKWIGRKEVKRFIETHQSENGSYGTLLSTYYIMPILAAKPMQSLRGGCNSTKGVTSAKLRKEDSSKNFVEYSLYLGINAETKHIIQKHVPRNTKFFDLMKIAANENPVFKFEYEITSIGYPVVYSIAGLPNDAERGSFWYLYTVTTTKSLEDKEFHPQTGDIRNLKLKNGDQVIFWFKESY